MRFTTLLVSCASLGVLAACGNKDDTKAVETTTSDSSVGGVSPSAAAADARGTSMVRFVNAMPGSSPLTISSDSMAVFSAIRFGDVSPYQELRDNVKTFSLGVPGAAQGTASNTETMRDGGRYTILAMPDKDGNASMKIFRDELSPDSGKARIRVIHAAPGLDDIDVMMKGQSDELFDDVDFGSEAGFKDVTPAASGFTIRHKDKDLVVQNLAAMTLKAGSAYTIVLLAGSRGTVQAVTFADEMIPTAATTRP